MAAHTTSRLLWRRAVFAAGLALLAVLLWVRLDYPASYQPLVAEDGVVESAQAIAFALAACLAFAVSRTLRRQGSRLAQLYLGAAAALFLVAGEEVCWGQRLLGLATPSLLAAANSQHELTLHNLRGCSYITLIGYIAIGLAGGLGWLILPRLGRWRREGGLLVPGWHLAPFFLPVAMVYTLLGLGGRVGELLFGGVLPHRGAMIDWVDQEPAELLLALGVLVFLVEAYRSARSASAPTALS